MASGPLHSTSPHTYKAHFFSSLGLYSLCSARPFQGTTHKTPPTLLCLCPVLPNLSLQLYLFISSHFILHSRRSEGGIAGLKFSSSLESGPYEGPQIGQSQLLEEVENAKHIFINLSAVVLSNMHRMRHICLQRQALSTVFVEFKMQALNFLSTEINNTKLICSTIEKEIVDDKKIKTSMSRDYA